METCKATLKKKKAFECTFTSLLAKRSHRLSASAYFDVCSSATSLHCSASLSSGACSRTANEKKEKLKKIRGKTSESEKREGVREREGETLSFALPLPPPSPPVSYLILSYLLFFSFFKFTFVGDGQRFGIVLSADGAV